MIVGIKTKSNYKEVEFAHTEELHQELWDLIQDGEVVWFKVIK